MFWTSFYLSFSSFNDKKLGIQNTKHTKHKTLAHDDINDQFCDIMKRSSHRRCSIKRLFSKILQKLQEKTCVGVSLFPNKIAGLSPVTLLTKKLRHKCFLVNFAKFLRTAFFKEQPLWLLLYIQFNEFKSL